jgi:hypothetical protein
MISDTVANKRPRSVRAVCCTTQSIDLRRFERRPDPMATGLVPALSCHACRPHEPFAELMRLASTSITDGVRLDYTRQVLGD